MKNNKKQSRIQLFVLKKKTNNNGMLNPISYCFYILPSVYVSAQKKLTVVHEIKRENLIGKGVHPIPTREIRPSSHPIPWDNNFFKSIPWDGMGWDRPIPLGALIDRFCCRVV